jgi:outer membrane protein TolC
MHLSHRASLLALLIFAPVLRAEESPAALELEETQALAVAQKPLLLAQEAAVRAARESAVAASQLPDPQLSFEVRDLPANGEDRYSFTRDSGTQSMLGITQEFPPGDTRRLRGERAEHETDLAEQMLMASRLQVRRDAGLAWLEVWRTERALELTQASEREAQLQLQAVEIGYSAGRATQADILAARVALSLVQDESANLRQQSSHYRNSLSRWIGEAAYRLLCPDLPAWGALPAITTVLERLRTHPLLNAEARRVDVAAAEVALARQAYKPGWRAGLVYGYRPAFSEMVTLQLGIDLPVFTASRQDRTLAAKLAEQDQAEQMRDDQFRQQAAEARLNNADWQLLQERLRRYDTDILPQSEQRIQAALAAWQSGLGILPVVLEARRMALDNRLKRLDLELDAARRRINLQYLAGERP